MSPNRGSAQLRRADGSPVRAVVADDEEYLADLLRMTFRAEGWDVEVTHDGRAALDAIRSFGPDIVVLDIMMPGLDGLEVLNAMRDRGDDTPVLFLTAKDGVDDRIAGITAGGDDYVTKPFSLEEVVARVRGLVRRHLRVTANDDAELRVGDLRLNEDTYDVFRGETRITLTSTEFELLRYLMSNPRHVLSKSQILDHVWSYDFGGRSSIVELYISYLRKKIDTLGEPLIHTVRGVGYTIREPDRT
ncbi:response regulator transcription factor [Pseudoclavibacter chungangensis]|uniref:Response regulator transcription factor n=1 Tax=Pseudoclavibacter chungangensis TaxID=587635 RepID=A0A7J5BTJ0_9MICO|nr:response regulator transcription factor [Pseudoclavibacter chungangensis]KAB1656796.1 response regulator transcription factor [Pseudoclavibacter chungangensis]NYJ67245.1 two-component system OmpR family response regulator [Pseudoclavibacter chungangensis]